MPDTEIKYWLTLATVPDLGPARYLKLIRHFGSPENVLAAGRDELMTVEGIGKSIADNIRKKSDSVFVEKQIKLLENKPFEFCHLNSDNYPALLKKIYDPPPFFFYQGDLDCLSKPTIAMVGSRSLSVYGKMMAEKLARELAEAGFTTVSGFARGIDTISHRCTLEAGGTTAAVFGSGLDIMYPPENKTLYQELVSNGVAISEFFLGTRPDPYNFPRRNRIISGLSLGVLVVEAADRSGALLTAEHALDQGREVFAVPGNINSKTSQGTNAIIKQGAKLVTSAEDIMEEFKFLVPRKAAVPERDIVLKLDENQRKIFEVLSHEPIQIDKIVKRSGLTVSHALEILLDLELNGHVRQLSGKMFVKQL